MNPAMTREKIFCIRKICHNCTVNHTSRKPRLGQHFLVNSRAIQSIIQALEPKAGETIIEIGPGRGALTLPLLETCREKGCAVVAIEKDLELVNLLTSQLVNWENAQIIQGDALRELPKLINQLTNQSRRKAGTPTSLPNNFNKASGPINYKIVGNIPYYITGKLLRLLSELPVKPARTILTIQREVAERIVAKPPSMNLLAAAVQVWAKPSIVMKLAPGDFSPPPEVNSAIILLETKPSTNDELRITGYYPFIRKLFKQPRKTIFNNLRSGYPKLGVFKVRKRLRELAIEENVRPQDISLPLLIKLASHMRDQKETV